MREQNIATESEVFLNKHSPSASLLFEDETALSHSRLNHAVWEVIYQEFLWYGLIITYYTSHFQHFVKKLF